MKLWDGTAYYVDYFGFITELFFVTDQALALGFNLVALFISVLTCITGPGARPAPPRRNSPTNTAPRPRRHGAARPRGLDRHRHLIHGATAQVRPPATRPRGSTARAPLCAAFAPARYCPPPAAARSTGARYASSAAASPPSPSPSSQSDSSRGARRPAPPLPLLPRRRPALMALPAGRRARTSREPCSWSLARGPPRSPRRTPPVPRPPTRRPPPPKAPLSKRCAPATRPARPTSSPARAGVRDGHRRQVPRGHRARRARHLQWLGQPHGEPLARGEGGAARATFRISGWRLVTSTLRIGQVEQLSRMADRISRKRTWWQVPPPACCSPAPRRACAALLCPAPSHLSPRGSTRSGTSTRRSSPTSGAHPDSIVPTPLQHAPAATTAPACVGRSLPHPRRLGAGRCGVSTS